MLHETHAHRTWIELHDSVPAARWVPGRRMGASESEAKFAK